MIYIYYYAIQEDDTTEKIIELIEHFGAPIDMEPILAYKNKNARLTKLIGRLVLFLILQKHFDIEAQDFIIASQKHGKPYLKERRDIHFNISHSGNYIVWAVATQTLGIDIEKIDKAPLRVAERFFSEDERKRISKTKDPVKQNALFYSFWAAKESYLKFVGTGISGSLSSFTIHLTDDGGYVQKEKKILPLQLYCINDIPGYSCYLTYEMEVPTTIRVTELDRLGKHEL
ncbi:MAG: 4'-phosphopantetheinyl transferase family protein [Marinifilaceae bacterium]